MQFLARRSEEFLLPQSEFTPHRFACGLTPLAHRRTFPSESPTLKGGVIFLSSLDVGLLQEEKLYLQRE